MLYVAATMLANARWPAVLLPALVAHLHYIVVLREEQVLEEAFDDDFRRYR